MVLIWMVLICDNLVVHIYYYHMFDLRVLFRQALHWTTTALLNHNQKESMPAIKHDLVVRSHTQKEESESERIQSKVLYSVGRSLPSTTNKLLEP